MNSSLVTSDDRQISSGLHLRPSELTLRQAPLDTDRYPNERR